MSEKLSQQCALQPRKPVVSWAASTEGWQAGNREGIVPLCSGLVRPCLGEEKAPVRPHCGLLELTGRGTDFLHSLTVIGQGRMALN